VCIHYDADPDRRIADPARAILVGGHLAPDLIRLSGGAPLFTQPGDTAKWVAFDEIRAAQPDVILQFDCHGCPTARKHPIPRRPGWSGLAAVAGHAVYPLRANISDPNLCFSEALEELVGIMNTYAAQNPMPKGCS
jgi:ABC-type Fe3+-hydroxamate transport system substrate-binding protein